ncbi:MAG: c-type cytochrome [Eudoraea sp.]|nr:c-type cytochrome [Eudoraea sp.]
MSGLPDDIQDKWVVPAKYEKMKNPYAGVNDADNLGRILYIKHCRSCHGSKGKGDGTKAKGLETAIRDFSGAEFKKQSDGSMYYKTFIGRDEMPSFIKKIPDEEEQWMIINYVKSL